MPEQIVREDTADVAAVVVYFCCLQGEDAIPTARRIAAQLGSSEREELVARHRGRLATDAIIVKRAVETVRITRRYRSGPLIICRARRATCSLVAKRSTSTS